MFGLYDVKASPALAHTSNNSDSNGSLKDFSVPDSSVPRPSSPLSLDSSPQILENLTTPAPPKSGNKFKLRVPKGMHLTDSEPHKITRFQLNRRTLPSWLPGSVNRAINCAHFEREAFWLTFMCIPCDF